MSAPYVEGVRAQADNLRRSAEVVAAALSGGVGSRIVAAIRGGVTLACGMGASTHAAVGFAAALRAAGRPAIAVSAADLAEGVPPGLAATMLGVSQSGRSRETVEALAAAPGETNRLGLTNDPGSPLGAIADAVLPLGCVPDTAVTTLSYTATLQALGLLADRVTGHSSADWRGLPALAEAVLGTDVAPLVEVLSAADSVDVVASGVRAATAGAVALLLREAAHLPSAHFTTREYLHGPLETAGPRRTVLLFGAEREASLAAELAGYGADVVLITDIQKELPAHPQLRVLRLPPAGGLAGCVLDILPVQLAAHSLAEQAGRTIELRHLPADTKLAAS